MIRTTIWTPTADHAAAIARLDKSAYDNRGLTAARWSRWLRSPAAVAVAAGPVAEPAAVAVAEPTGTGEFRLHRLAVAADHRRRGLGRRLVELIGERHGLRLRLRETNRGGLEFATAVGFVVCGVERGGFGDLDAVTLRRPPGG